MASPAEPTACSTFSVSQLPEEVSENRSPQQDDTVMTLSYGLVYRRTRGVRTMASLKRDLKGQFPTWLRRRNEAIEHRKKKGKEPVIQCDCQDCQSCPGPSGIVKDYDLLLSGLPEWKEHQPAE